MPNERARKVLMGPTKCGCWGLTWTGFLWRCDCGKHTQPDKKAPVKIEPVTIPNSLNPGGPGRATYAVADPVVPKTNKYGKGKGELF